MITLGIFGDSFASELSKKKIPDKSWIQFIRDEGKHTITNYATGGSNLWYSYDLFLQNHHLHEKIIFLITNPHRIMLPEESSYDVHKFQNYHQVLQMCELNPKSTDFQSLKQYYENIHNVKQEESLHNLMVKEIKSIRPDAILYNSLSLDRSVYSLFDVVLFENKFLGIDVAPTSKLSFKSNVVMDFYKKGKTDSRKCHMTEENNRVVADMFLKRLDGIECTISDNDLVKPTKPLEYYFSF